MIINIKYVGIDNWNRPVFKTVDKVILYNWKEPKYAYFGSVDTLFPYEELEVIVLNDINVDELQYFGINFGCEPHGGLPKDVELKIAML